MSKTIEIQQKLSDFISGNDTKKENVEIVMKLDEEKSVLANSLLKDLDAGKIIAVTIEPGTCEYFNPMDIEFKFED